MTPAQVLARVPSLSGHWATVGTGWQTYPDLVSSDNVVLVDGQMLLPQAEDMLPLALSSWASGQAVSVENAEPVYLRNEVTWKKLPGR